MLVKLIVLIGVILIEILIILGVLALAITVAVVYIKSKLKNLSQKLFNTDSLIQGYNIQKKELSQTPKSISSMTRIYLPQIQNDFPEFNYEEFKIKSENMLKSALTAISCGNIDLLIESSQDFKDAVSLIIQNNKNLEQKEYYNDIKIYQTEINGYTKASGTCVITLQSAISYMHYITDSSGGVVSGSNELIEQCKYNIDIVYIQDRDKMTTNSTTSIGTNCPNCGAPITNLGEKFCRFCGTGITVVNVNVWSINKYTKI